jgi:dihydrofolate reductase
MRKIIFSIPITLDGFIEGVQHELDWVMADDELHDFYTELLQNGDLMLFGRVTYTLMAGYWPAAASDPASTPGMRRFANALNPMRKIVFSKTLTEVGWNTQIIHDFIPEKIQAMKAQPGGAILLSGGAMLAQAFFKHRLVDEYIPVIQPAALTHGKGLFSDLSDMPKMDFQWNRRFSSGAVALCYRMNGTV